MNEKISDGISKGRVGLLVAALRSGLYAKGPGTLHKYNAEAPGPFSGTWCCLGVAGDVARRFGLTVSEGTENWGSARCEKIDGSSAYMGENVANWYGFSGENPVLIKPDGMAIAASDWNDMDATTFEDIAQGFERTYLQ